MIKPTYRSRGARGWVVDLDLTLTAIYLPYSKQVKWVLTHYQYIPARTVEINRAVAKYIFRSL